LQSRCPAGVPHERVAPKSRTVDSAFKVRLIPGIAFYLKKSGKKFSFSNYYFITFVYICSDTQSCCPAGVPHESVTQKSTTVDSAFKVRLIPSIAYYLN